jgi:hypothetical protein
MGCVACILECHLQAKLVKIITSVEEDDGGSWETSTRTQYLSPNLETVVAVSDNHMKVRLPEKPTQ